MRFPVLVIDESSNPSTKNPGVVYHDAACVDMSEGLRLKNSFDLKLPESVKNLWGTLRGKMAVVEVSNFEPAFGGRWRVTGRFVEIDGKPVEDAPAAAAEPVNGSRTRRG